MVDIYQPQDRKNKKERQKKCEEIKSDILLVFGVNECKDDPKEQ